MTDKSIREELTELTGAVRELRDREVADTLRELRAEVEKLRAERAAHQCFHAHYWTYPPMGTVTYPSYVVTCGSGTTVTATNGYLSAGNTTTLSLGN